MKILQSVKQVIFIVIFLLSPVIILAANLQKDSVNIDKSRISVRNPGNASLSQFYSDESFDYIVGNEAKVSLWEQIKLWFWYNVLRFIFSDEAYPALRILFYVVVFSIFIYFILRLLKVDVTGLFYRNKSADNKIEADIIKKSDNVDFDKLIQEKINLGNYREVTRLLFIRALSALNARKLITWSRDKTNSDYIRELKEQKMKEQFSYISFLFEYIWYGEFMVSKDHFERIYRMFNQFHEDYNLPV
jgi:hypothetical protein